MAIRQIGGQPVYVVEVDVPKVTDARGRSYGTLVSDLRWKLWEEVQNSQLQTMKYEQLSKQAQLDVLEQKQRDISRSIRDAREIQSKIKSGGASPGEAARLKLAYAKANQSVTTTKEEPVFDIFGNAVVKDKKPVMKTATTTRTPTPIGLSSSDFQALKGEQAASAASSQTFAEAARSELDDYIASLETQQTQLGQQFTRFAAQPTRDLLGSTRDAFQTQIGEGGFGISRRPLRELPRFDEGAAIGVIGEASKREESALLDEAMRRKSQNARERITEIEAMGQEDEMTGALLADLNKQALNPQISLDEEKQIRELARKRLAEGMTAAGAQPTGRAGFLMKDFPQGSALLPREETRFPTGRMRDDFTVASEGESLDRETVVRGELDRVGLGSPEAEGLLMELEDIRRTKRAPVNAPSSLPEAQRRAIEMDALGVSAEEAQTRGATPTERGFNLPVERMGEGFGQTTTFGTPGGGLDRLNVATRKSPVAPSPSQEREQMDSIQFGGGVIPGSPTQPGMEDAATDEVINAARIPRRDAIRDTTTVGSRGNLPPMSKTKLPEGERIPLGDGVMYDPLDRVIYGKEGFPIFRESKEANPNSAAPYQPQIVTPQELQNKVQEIKEAGGYEPPQAKKSIPQRRELYGLKIVKEGSKLAEKPKQFARVAKTDNPSTAPEYVKLVNQIYELNSNKPDRFKLTFDEIARVYKNDAKTREKAHAFLVAADMLQEGVTRPQA